jgi:hypothetical protein
MLINRESAFTTTCTLIKWYSFLFTNWSSCCEPIAQGIQENKRKFYDIGNFPNIFGLIDGTYVRIIAPSQHEDQFVNRKEYHSINVQVEVNADSRFINT